MGLLTVLLTFLVLLFVGLGEGQQPVVNLQEVAHQAVCHRLLFAALSQHSQRGADQVSADPREGGLRAVRVSYAWSPHRACSNRNQSGNLVPGHQTD